MKLLAIDPGTREMGTAFFDGQALIYHEVQRIEKQSSPQATLRECRKVILRLINDFHPQVLAVEKAFFANNRSAALVNVLVDEIKAVARRKEIKVVGYAPTTVKKSITGNGRASKRTVAEVIVARYPKLKVYLTQDRAWKERYHQNMFDAVALGVLAMERMAHDRSVKRIAC